MDHSNKTNQEFPLEVYTYGERIFVAIVIIFVALIGSVGNTAVILAVAFSRKLQNSTYVFVTNLAVCDLLTCLFLPWSAVAVLGKNGWPLPKAEWLCSAAAFMVFACIITSLYNLAAIAVNRYVLICHTFDTFTKMFSIRNICAMVTISWLLPCSVVLILPLAGIGQLGYDEFGGNGCTDIDSHPKAKIYQMAQVLINVFPIITIIVCYSLIFVHVRSHFHRQKKSVETPGISYSIDNSHSMDLDTNQNTEKVRETPAKKVSSCVESDNESATQLSGPESDTETTSTYRRRNKKKKKLKRQQLKVTGRLFLIVCAFFFCITPYCIAISIVNIKQRVIIYTALLTIVSSATNPMIYSLTHPHFNEIFAAMFKCRFGDIPQPSNILRRFIQDR